jgi:hypothetical protein
MGPKGTIRVNEEVEKIENSLWEVINELGAG